jgi:hypothetical protein
LEVEGSVEHTRVVSAFGSSLRRRREVWTLNLHSRRPHRTFSTGKRYGRNFSDSFQCWPSLSGLRSNPYSCQRAFKEIGETLKVRLSIEFAMHLSSSQCVHERVALYPGRPADNSGHVFISRPELTDGINAHATICTGKISALCRADKCPPDRCEG